MKDRRTVELAVLTRAYNSRLSLDRLIISYVWSRPMQSTPRETLTIKLDKKRGRRKNVKLLRMYALVYNNKSSG